MCYSSRGKARGELRVMANFDLICFPPSDRNKVAGLMQHGKRRQTRYPTSIRADGWGAGYHYPRQYHQPGSGEHVQADYLHRKGLSMRLFFPD